MMNETLDKLDSEKDKMTTNKMVEYDGGTN